jgi:hypothetical protein
VTYGFILQILCISTFERKNMFLVEFIFDIHLRGLTEVYMIVVV